MGEERYPPIGTVLLGKYVVDSLIGIGGMGAVVKARHLELDEPVAIKLLLPEMHGRADIVARFLREAKASVKLRSAHVARIIDVGRLDDATPYIVMEYLAGPDLSRYLKQGGALAPGLAVDLLVQACEGIAEAHSIGVIHRDIKAANFVVTEVDDRPQLKVLDFGIATAPEGASDLTTTDSVFGTPAYMAPEQMRSTRVADERSDIWSLGVVLYEVLEGRRPFRAETSPALVLAVGMDPPDPMVLTPPALREVVLKCLDKVPESRFQSVALLAEALAPHAGDRARATTTAQECARILRRTPPKRKPRDSIPDLANLPTVVDRPRELTSVTDSNGESRAVARPRRRVRWGLALAAPVVLGAMAITRPWESTDDVTPQPAPALIETSATGCQPLDKVDPEDPRPPCKAGSGSASATELFELARTQREHGDLVTALATLERLRSIETNSLARKMIEQTIAEVTAERAKAEASRTKPTVDPRQEQAKAFQAKLLYGDALFAQGQYGRAKETYSALRRGASADLIVTLTKKIAACDRALKADRKPVDPLPVATRETVTAAFLAVKRGYENFRTTHGQQLEHEWADLQIFLQRVRDDNLVEATNRIEAFRLKIRETLLIPP